MNILSLDERGSDDPGTTQIVGPGASAGGLEALEQFLANVPVDSGLAYIVVQDLDPTHKAMLVELLQRATVMPVRSATESLRVEPNVIYVIPPNTELSVVRGLLHICASGHRHCTCDKPGHPCNQSAVRSRTCRGDPSARLAVETMPSFAPRAAARSQPVRCVLCVSRRRALADIRRSPVTSPERSASTIPRSAC